MSLFVLEAFTWVLGIRGHIPQSRGFGEGPRHQAFATNRGIVMRALAVFVVTTAFLGLALWAAVWLAIKWL
jgi:hypothetical protein